MSILIIVFFTLGFLVLSYTGWLGLKFYGHSKTQKDTPQQLEDLEKTLVKEIKKSGNKLGKKIDGLVDEIRQDRNERNKPTE